MGDWINEWMDECGINLSWRKIPNNSCKYSAVTVGEHNSSFLYYEQCSMTSFQRVCKGEGKKWL